MPKTKAFQIEEALDKAIYYLLALFALTTALSISLSEIGFFGAFFLWLGKMAYKGKWEWKSSSADLPLAIFTALTIVACFIGLDNAGEIRNRLKPLSLMFMFPLVLNNLKDKKTVQRLLLFLLLSLVCASAYIIFKSLSSENIKNGLGIGGTLGHTLTAGEIIATLMAVSAGLFFYSQDKKIRIFSAVVFFTALPALFLTLARSGWVALLVMLLVLAFIKSKRLFIAVFLLLIIGLGSTYLVKENIYTFKIHSLFRGNYTTNYERVDMWKSGFRMLKDSPLGIGIDNVYKTYPKYRESGSLYAEHGHLHNNYLQLAVERGFLALGAFLWLLYVFVSSAYRRFKTSKQLEEKAIYMAVLLSLVVFMFAGLFEYGLGSALYAPIFWFFGALAVGKV